MPQLYVLRRFSSWSFRLSVSVALLVSSAGLAASLLVSTAMGSAEAPSLSWQPATHLAQSASGLRPSQLAEEAFLPAALSSAGLSYSFASGAVASAPADGLLPAQSASSPPMLPLAASSFKTTMQRSWDTFKLAFR